MTTEPVTVTIPLEALRALAQSADQTGCDVDLVVVGSSELATVLRAADIRVWFATPEDPEEDAKA